MSGLPVGWAGCLLEDLLGPLSDGKILHQGWSPQCESIPAPEGEWGVLKTTAVQDGYFLEDENKKLPIILSPKPELEVTTGDLLMTCAGPRSRCGVICHVPNTRSKLIFSGKIYRFRPNAESVEPKFLTHLLRTAELKEKIDQIKTGISESGMNMTRERFFALPVRLAPLAEQTRIAAKLDELLAQVDTLTARIDGIPALLKRFRQAVLAAAVSGRLTEDWRGGSALESESSMPVSWVLTRLDQCVKAQNGKAFPSADYKNDGIRLIRPGNLHVSGRVVWNDSNTVCLDKAHMAGNDRYFVRAGDIVMNLTAQSLKDDFLGRVCVYADEFPALLNQRQCVFVFEDDSPLLREYLFWYFRSPQFRAFVDTLDSGSLIKHMYTKQLAGHEVAIPTVDEQTEIVRRVEQLFAFADQLEARIKTAQTRIDRLTQSILAKAFCGELVPQDPNDEPASVLLERIKAQRAASGTAKKTRSKRYA